MFIDARSLPSGQKIESHVCIIGAGAAGITLAREFANSSLRVSLLESGGFDIEADTQDLYAGEVIGHPYHALDLARLRYFGGTTNHWAGYSRPLDSTDFERRSYVAESGWPFARADLDPYYLRALPICQVGAGFTFDGADWTHAPSPPYAFASGRIVTRAFHVGPPTRFGAVYRAEIAAAPNVAALLHANVTEIKVDGEAATELRVSCIDGKSFVVHADVFVLACGALENARLLLSSNSVRPAGLGNSHDNVGRYFMDHPIIWRAGLLVTSDRYKQSNFYSVEQPMNGHKVIGFFNPSNELLRAEQMLNCAVMLDPVNLSALSPAVTSAKYLLEAIDRGRWPEHLATHVGTMLSEPGELAAGAHRRLFKPTPRHFHIRFWTEIPPDRDSRVTLGTETDALGLRRVRLDWRLPTEFERTYKRMLELLGQEFGMHGLGRVQVGMDGSIEAALASAEDSFHSMGTTRIHDSPRKGVVDSQCRVHDVQNLYVAGSSVFPTYGHSNPTLTIVALALRLADHLKQRLAAAGRRL